jgi:hypothetical protein
VRSWARLLNDTVYDELRGLCALYRIQKIIHFIPDCFKQITLLTMECFKETTRLTTTKPSVRFDDEVLTTGSTESFHDQQQTTLWYSQSDFKCFRKETPDNFIAPNPCRQRLVKSILSQQWEHQKLGMTDPKGLQKLSRACSKDARERAHALAIANVCDVNGTVPDSATMRSPMRISPTRKFLKLSASPSPRRLLPKAVCFSALSA